MNTVERENVVGFLEHQSETGVPVRSPLALVRGSGLFVQEYVSTQPADGVAIDLISLHPELNQSGDAGKRPVIIEKASMSGVWRRFDLSTDSRSKIVMLGERY